MIVLTRQSISLSGLIGDLAHGERLSDAAALLCDNDTFEYLDTGLVALLDLDVYTDSAS